MQLYSYWRSTTSYRVRIALGLKGIEFETIPIDLVAGEQKAEAYESVNPIKGVPSLVTQNGSVLTQSMAILDYLDETVPDPHLLPQDDPVRRAQIRAAAMVIATDIHPVNNLKVVTKLQSLAREEDVAPEWMRHWMVEGFGAFDALIDPNGFYCFGDMPSLADVCLIPQLYNAHRWGLDLSPWPRLTEIETRCLALPAFYAARPERQKDSPCPV